MANIVTLRRPTQRAICCPCGSAKTVAQGLCGTCYTLRRQDAAYFGGLREAVLARDHDRCRVCRARRRGKRSIAVHHRKPGVSLLHLMIALCPKCHARVSRTKVLVKPMEPLLLTLWREQHPQAPEQLMLMFEAKPPQSVATDLFAEIRQIG